MFSIKRLVFVPYTSKQMYTLVNNIDDYSSFISGCFSSKVLTRNDNELIGEIGFIKYGVSSFLVTHNIMEMNKSIFMNLIQGPFKYFYGYWYFSPMSTKCSKVECSLKFEFKKKFFEYIFDSFFLQETNDILMSFVNRAKVIYDC